MKVYQYSSLLLIVLATLLSGPVLAKEKKKPAIKPAKIAPTTELRQDLKTAGTTRLDGIADRFRKGELSEQQVWVETARIAEGAANYSRAEKVRILQTQSQLLMRDRYSVLAAIYAAQAIKLSGNPFDAVVEPSWSVLKQVSEQEPIQNFMESLAETLVLDKNSAPGFDTDWYYYVGNYLTRLNRYPDAIAAYAKVKLTDRYYFPAKFHEATALVQQEKLEDAAMALQKILYSTSQDLSNLDEKSREEMSNMARLALGRIYFEQKEFEKSFRAYRAVTKNSPRFYDALFEQSWAFFMGGYPNHALGAIHSIESPFFKDRDNPEATMLKSIVYFWMCRYEESRAALTDFNEKYDKSIAGLGYFLNRNRLTDESAYDLFENYISGVSSESLGIPRELLATAATQDAMMQVRDQYASVLEEKRRLTASGVFRTRQAIEGPMKHLENWEQSLKKELGSRFLKEVMAFRDTYDRLHDQAQFLEVELLMSQKEQILGKELHASNKIAKVSPQKRLSGWGKNNSLSWSAEDKEEFWWDEVGYYIYQVEPTCNLIRQ